MIVEIDAVQERRIRLIVNSYYDILDQRIRTDHRVRNYAEHAGLVAVVGEEQAEKRKMEGMETYRKAIREIKDDPIFVQAGEAARLELENWHRDMDKVMGGQEAYLKRLAMKEIEAHPYWTEWLSKVNGIGPCLAGGLIAWLDLKRCPHVSNLWKYCGLSVVNIGTVCLTCGNKSEDEPKSPTCSCGGTLFRLGEADRRRQGEKLGYNPKAKTLAWKIGSQFVRGGGKYRGLYDKLRLEIESKPCHKIHTEKGSKKVIPCSDTGHVHAKAQRMTVKIFLSHYWQRGREILGLPTPKPYPFGILGHDASGFIEPMTDE